MSFNGDNAVAATGGAAIATAFGTSLAATLAPVLQALADGSGSASPAVRPKGMIPQGYLCPGGGDATLEWPEDEPVPGAGTIATLTLEDCVGSPLSGTAVNGRLLLDLTAIGTGFNPLEADASFAGLADPPDVFTIDGDPSDTLVTGTFDFTADYDPSIFDPASVAISLADLDPAVLVTISEGSRSLVLECFDMSTRLTIKPEPTAITSFLPSGVLSLGGEVYTLNDPDNPNDEAANIGFPPDSAVPNSGTLMLYSGGVCDGEGDAGDVSTITATIEPPPPGRVGVEVRNATGGCSGCWVNWESLLDTLSEIVSPTCDDDAFECEGTGGTGGTAGTGGAGGTGGTAGSGGTGGSCLPFERPIRTHCVDYTAFTTDCFPQPEFREGVQIDIQGSSINYKMTVRGLPTMGTTALPDQYDFHPCAVGTLSGMTATGTGEFVRGIASQDPDCSAPEARLSFDIDFDDSTLATYTGTINFDFLLDAACGSSICFASASVAGGPCP